MNLFEKCFVINTGKGGVGKTTISAAMALASARKGMRVLTIELNTREKISRLFGHPPVGPMITPIHDNIWSVNITPEAALKEYALMTVRFESIYRMVFENRYVKQLIQVIPGLRELLLIGKAAFHVDERDKQGEPIYDMVIVDAPATGHGLFLLKIPQVITRAVPNSPMARASQRIVDLLGDPQRTLLNLVTITEELAVNETIELEAKIEASLDVPMGYLISNGIYPRLISAHQASQVMTLADTRGRRDDLLDKLLEAAIFRHERCNLQNQYLDLLQDKIPLPMIEVPYFFDAQFDLSVISKIADHIEGCVEGLAHEG